MSMKSYFQNVLSWLIFAAEKTQFSTEKFQLIAQKNTFNAEKFKFSAAKIWLSVK